MKNIFKTPLYFFLQHQLKYRHFAYLGGNNTIDKARELIQKAIDDCCIPDQIRTNNKFLKLVLMYLRQFNLPKDKKKLNFILTEVFDKHCC